MNPNLRANNLFADINPPSFWPQNPVPIGEMTPWTAAQTAATALPVPAARVTSLIPVDP